MKSTGTLKLAKCAAHMAQKYATPANNEYFSTSAADTGEGGGDGSDEPNVSPSFPRHHRLLPHK